VIYEQRHQPPVSRAQFARRIALHAALVALLLAVSLAVGMAGYMTFEGLSALDAFLNSAMLLGGMGPVDLPKTPAGKLFAGGYALYAGLVFIAATALLLALVVHRVMHRFHWDDKA
jgi:membrane protein implicated in regulation of membrane protease activity